MTKINKNCINCGSNIEFSPKRKCLHCNSCDSNFDTEYNNNIESHPIQNVDTLLNTGWIKDKQVTNCANCGCSVILEGNQTATTCIYCGSSLVTSSEARQGLKPDSIIPYAIEKADASELYVKNIRKKWFLPNIFKKKVPINEVVGIYVPSFNFSANTFTKYKGVLQEHYTVFVNGKSVVRVSFKNISGTFSYKTKDVFVESSNYMEQKDLDSIIPFVTQEGVKYNDDFVRGFNLENYNETPKELQAIARNKIEDSIKSEILSKYTYDGISSFNMQVDYLEENFNYEFLPTYKVDYKYKEKNYRAFMNGQTGKVGGKIPRSPAKITFFVLFLLLCAGVLGLIFYKTGALDRIISDYNVFECVGRTLLK